MARTNRPPLAEARDYATKALIDEHKDEYQELVDNYLEIKGWTRQTETTQRWVNDTTGINPQGGN